MILGKIIGKTTTNKFHFLVKGDVKKFQYVQVMSKELYILGQVIEIEKSDESIADCIVLGHRESGMLKGLRIPLEPGSEVLEADDEFIQKTLGLEQKEGALIGTLEDREKLNVILDLNQILTKHVTILAKSGAGKSYLTAVLIEELLEKKVPLLVIDPHGEYSSLKYPNETGKGAKGYLKQIQEYALDETGIPLRLNKTNLEAQELIHLLPAKLSSVQLGVLYAALKNLSIVDFGNLKLQLEIEDTSAKWTLIHIIEYLENLHLFSETYTPYEDIIQVGKASLINLRGVRQDIQEIVVYKLLKDLFLERKKGNIPPFLLVLEEAHNFCLAENTKIMTSRGERPISKIKKSDKIATLNENNLLEFHYPNKIYKNKPQDLYEVTTKFGNKLIATKDHSILTRDGFKYVSGLNEMLVPLQNNYSMEKDLVIARLIGHILGDGWLSHRKSVGFSGQHIDLRRIKEDLHFLSFTSSKITEKKSRSKINSIEYGTLNVNGSGFSMTSSVRCFKFMQQFDLPVGRKVLQEYEVPYFILKGSNMLKAEFLSTLMGSDGFKPRIKKKNVDALRISFSKIVTLDKNARKFGNQVIQLFGALGIRSKLKTRKGNLRKTDDKETIKYLIEIDNENQNVLRYFSRVGFKYCKPKEELASKILWYYRFKLNEINEKEKLRKRALEIREKTGYGKIKIAKMLHLSPGLVKFWLYNFKHSNRTKRAGLGRLNIMDFGEWCRKYTTEHFIMDPVKNKRYLGLKPVYNLSVKNENFIANGIVSHNCPERNFGESKSSSIIRQIFAEGRKFGLSVCLVSQRPSRVDKNALSQATTQIVMKMTNPHDLRAVISSMEGITPETQDEIKNLNIGTALVSGVIDNPLFVTVRQRRSKHGGGAVNVVPGKESELLPLIHQNISLEDMKVVHKDVKVQLIPCVLFRCVAQEPFNLLVNLVNGELITDIEQGKGVKIQNLQLMGKQERVFNLAFRLKEFKVAELFEKSGLQFSELFEVVRILTEKGYFVKEKEVLKVHPSYDVKSKQFYGSIEYSDLAYDMKESEKFSAEELRRVLSMYVDIKEKKNCWLVNYV